MKTSKITPEIEGMLRGEAQLRADQLRIRAKRQTNKQLAERTGFSPLYIAQMVARYRREIEISIRST
jgi:hypothetical protein